MDRNQDHQAKDGYEELFLAFGRKVDKWLAALVIVLLIALIVSQLLLQNPHLRYLLVRVEQLEGNPYDSSVLQTAAK